jgi:hypothetical protein
MTNIEYLQDFIGSTISHLDHIRLNGVRKELSFTISCGDLDDFNFVDIRKSEKFESIFKQLQELSGPTLYWFEIISDTDTKQVVESLKNYKTSKDAKATPALKAKINYDSKVLYVGKVKGTFWGRLIQHLGFFKVNGTQGLQLFYWAKDLSLNLKINIFVFDNNMADIMPIVEYTFAKRLQPLVGKHQ